MSRPGLFSPKSVKNMIDWYYLMRFTPWILVDTTIPQRLYWPISNTYWKLIFCIASHIPCLLFLHSTKMPVVHFACLCAVVASEQITSCQKCQDFLKEFFMKFKNWHIFFSELQLLFKFDTALKELLYDLLGKESEQQEFIGQTPIPFSVFDECWKSTLNLISLGLLCP